MELGPIEEDYVKSTKPFSGFFFSFKTCCTFSFLIFFTVITLIILILSDNNSFDSGVKKYRFAVLAS